MRKLIIGLIPAMVLIAVNFWATSNRERFPDPVATHWGLQGKPDGFGSLDAHLVAVSIAMGLVALVWLLVNFMQIAQPLRTMFQLLVGYLFVIVTAVMLGTLTIQFDTDDASMAELNWWLLIFVAPLFALIPLLLSQPKVLVTDELEVKLSGITFLKIPVLTIAAARPAQVRATDFGGWGIRYARKTTAFVPSSGAALELTLNDSTRVLIRTDFAEELVRQIEAGKSTG